MKTGEAQAVNEVPSYLESPIDTAQVNVRLRGKGLRGVGDKRTQVLQVIDFLWIEPHHPSTRDVERQQLIRSHELANFASFPIHWTVFVKGIRGVDNPELSIYQVSDECKLTVELSMFKETEVRWVAAPQVLDREAHSSHGVYFEYGHRDRHVNVVD